MDRIYRIKINHSAIEIILKMYEIGCAEKYQPEYLEKIRARGGVLLQVDAMKPLKGRSALYTARDYYTGLVLSSKHLPREGHEEIGAFLKKLKIYLNGLGISVLGVISDAHRGQLKAIETIFGPKIPHSLCHFHFFKLILLKPKGLDPRVLTTSRNKLRTLHYIKEYRRCFGGNHNVSSETPFVEHVLHDLYTLSNWNPRKKDPTFSGVAYYQRIQGITSVLANCVSDLDKKRVSVDKKAEKIIRKLFSILKGVLNSMKDEIEELTRIQLCVQELSKILEAEEEPAWEGLKRLRKFVDSLDIWKSAATDGSREYEFIVQLQKFVKTKGAKLFAYRLLPNAPRTNNSQEISFKQIKHLLRRTIGYGAAGAYLLAHGERMLFVNPEESFYNIVKILKAVNWSEARNKIKAERIPRNSIIYIIHDPKRWKVELAALMEKWALLKERI